MAVYIGQPLVSMLLIEDGHFLASQGQWYTPRVSPAAPYPFQLGSSAALLSQICASPVLRQNMFTFIYNFLKKIRRQANAHSQFCPWGRWVPPPPSSYAQSEHRWDTAAQVYPCSDVSSECPEFRHTRNNVLNLLTHSHGRFKEHQR